jgi:hypothetical protein
VSDLFARDVAFRGIVPDLRARPVSDERCPVCPSFVLEYYAVVEIDGAPYRIERVLGRSCASADCTWRRDG